MTRLARVLRRMPAVIRSPRIATSAPVPLFFSAFLSLAAPEVGLAQDLPAGPIRIVHVADWMRDGLLGKLRKDHAKRANFTPSSNTK